MKYGNFENNGKEYKINTPLTPSNWENYLFNDEYYLEINQMLQGSGSFVDNYNRKKYLEDYRYFYIKEAKSKEIWSPNYILLNKNHDKYSCVHGLYHTELTSENYEIESKIKVFVPNKGTHEVWQITLKNNSNINKEVEFFSVFGFYDHGVMGGQCDYNKEANIITKYAFPYHALYNEKEQAEKEKAFFYTFSDIFPNSVELSKSRFFGSDYMHGIPNAVFNDELSGIAAEAEEFCAAQQFKLSLHSGQETTFFIISGAANSENEIIMLKNELITSGFASEWDETERFWTNLYSTSNIETPDSNLNYFANYYLKKQITLLSIQNRGTTYCPVRNRLQDALGYSLIDPIESKKLMWDVLSRQRKDGFIQQWHFTDNSPPRGLCLLNHTDGAVWLVICIELMIRQCGNSNIWNEVVPYCDDKHGESVFKHIIKAINNTAENLGKHGLCLIGDGDWNDPINGVGREGRGESVWLSMALIYCINLIIPYVESDKEKQILLEKKNDIANSINKFAWCGKYYSVGFCDDGKAIGDSRNDDKIFLNTQSWAILSGVADNKKILEIENTLKNLETPFGPLLLSPPFQKWDSRWGRISLKKSGTTENGSVYCHASMFLAFAYAIQGNAEKLYDIIEKTLPTNAENPATTKLQIPTYLPNYYFGLRNSENFGRSSLHYGTGSAAWMLLLILEYVMGVKACNDGIYISPLMPKGWQKMHCTRKYKNSIYNVDFVRSGCFSVKIGEDDYTNKVLPYSENQCYNVLVTV